MKSSEIKVVKISLNGLNYELQSDGKFFKFRNHRIHGVRRVELKGKVNQYGYRIFSYGSTKGKSELASRMVAKHFCPNPENKAEVNHIDGNKLNNDMSNLEWVTHSENGIHAYRVLNRSTNGGKDFGGKGVVFHKGHNNWEAKVKRHAKTHYIGSFKTRNEAIVAAKKFKEQYCGSTKTSLT